MQNKDCLYQQIYSKIVQDIRQGKLHSGSKLPSIRKFADSQGISCNTVQNAYNQLLSEGYIVSKEKSGFFVSEFETELLEANPQNQNKIIKQKKEKSTEKNEKLNLSANLTDGSIFPYTTFRGLYREALSSKNDSILRETGDFTGDEEFREAIAGYLYNHRGINCSSSQIIIGGGTAALLQQLTSLFSILPSAKNQKPVFLLEEPGYNKTWQIINNSGCPIIQVPLDSEGADISQVINQTKEKDKNFILHITPSHQFPMGMTMTASRRNTIFKWAYEAENHFIIEDDYDSDFRYKGHSIPAMTGSDTKGKIIYTGTFSRTLTPSMRISYAVLPETLAEIYRNNFSYYTCPVSRLEQQVLSVFIKQGYFERHISRAKKIYRERRDIMLKLLKTNFPECKIYGEEAGLHFVVKISENSNQQTLQEIIKKADDKNLVLNGTASGYLIIGYAHLNEQQMSEAVNTLKKLFI
ncbi:MAG: PLP-dependent aminotransferase family protein [Treponema sp.]|nr:PLP-dependent aminotransferase family protein [Treponema sp.]